jgi:hypothetical protein
VLKLAASHRRCVLQACRELNQMKGHVYKILELVGSSEKGTDDTIQNAISRASKTIREMKWFEVVQTRGHIESGLFAITKSHCGSDLH